MKCKVMMMSGKTCMTCKRMVPVFQKVAKEYEGRVEFEEKDALDCVQFLLERHIDLSTLPSFLFFRDDNVFMMLTGVVSFDKFCEAVDELLEE